MAVQAGWRLPERITELSTTPWPQAKREWKLNCITMLSDDEIAKSCLCGHTPIHELCHIENKVNHNRTIVGNHCIKQFSKETADDDVFTAIPRIFDASKRILSDPSKSANEDLINHAYDRGVFNKWEKDFYLNVWRKRSLSSAQEKIKDRLNTRLIHLVILSTRKAFERLTLRPNETTGPNVINFAHDHGVLSPREQNFYLRIWNQANLSATDRIERNRLNHKIIQELQIGELS